MQSAIYTISDVMKSLNSNDYDVDEVGRIVIRPKIDTNYLHLGCEEHALIKNKKLLNNKLINPEDRIVRQPILTWIARLQSRLDQVTGHPSDAGQIAEIFNQAGLIMQSIGQSDLARNLCYEQISLFRNWSGTYPLLLKYIVQPWINLSRLDRYASHHAAAIHKLQCLVNYDLTDVLTSENHLSLKDSIESCDIIKDVIRFCGVVDLLKTYLMAEQYELIIDKFNLDQSQSNKIIDAFICEARAIAFANTQSEQTALMELVYAKTRISPVRLPIFLIRECEFFINRNAVDQIPLQLDSVKMHLMNVLQQNSVNINDIIIALHFCDSLIAMADWQGVIQLGQECYKAACLLSDEVLQATAIITLAKCDLHYLNDEPLHDLASQLNQKTQYVTVNRVLSDNFQLNNQSAFGDQLGFSYQLYERLAELASRYR